MTRADIRTLMLSWLDDPQGAYFTAAQCNVWINLAQKQVQQKLLQAGENYYVKAVETTMVQYQQDYVLPADFMVLNRIEIITSGYGTTSESRQALAPTTPNQQIWIQTAPGVPISYFIKKDRITVLPIPDNTYYMRLYYSYRVADLGSDSDSPDVPDQYHEYIAILAAYDGFIKDDRVPSNIEMKRQVYEKLLEQMKQDRLQDVPRQVRITDQSDPYGVWY